MYKKTDTTYGYNGEIIPYEIDTQGEWGSFYVRRWPKPDSLPATKPKSRSSKDDDGIKPPTCALCDHYFGKIGQNLPMNRIRFYNERYILKPNDYPLVRNQLLCFVEPTNANNEYLPHRLEVKEPDVRLSIHIRRDGLTDLAYENVGDHPPVDSVTEESNEEKWVSWINPFTESAASQRHLHISMVKAKYIPLADWETLPWQVAEDKSNGVVISRFETNFYALAIDGKNPKDVAMTVTHIHEFMNKALIPYSFAAYEKNRVIIIPRSQAYSPIADQRIGTLELLTGVLVPGEKCSRLDTLQRDRAFQEVTLGTNVSLNFDRMLRGRFGMPPAGKSVYAHPSRYSI
ncbi:MAG: hypothetical protein AAF702_42905 [Chloroflexota bacterium]